MRTATRIGTRSTRSPVVLGVSLKLYLGVDETVAWVEAIADITRGHSAVESGLVRLFVLPSLPALTRVADVIRDTPIQLGAQDLFWEDRGAYTGAISGADLVDLGCTHVEVGHAERRTVFGEDAATTRRKFSAAVRNGLIPVLCIGERSETGVTDAVEACIDQLESAIADVDVTDIGTLIIAYEPEWAIGRAAPAAADHVTAVTGQIKERIKLIPGLVDTSVIYGGSAKAGLLSRIGGHVDGLFLGRFAHDPANFSEILAEAVQVGQSWSGLKQ